MDKILNDIISQRNKLKNKTLSTVKPMSSTNIRNNWVASFDFASLYPTNFRLIPILNKIRISKINGIISKINKLDI